MFLTEVYPLLKYIARQTYISLHKESPPAKPSTAEKRRAQTEALEKVLLAAKEQLEKRLESNLESSSVTITISTLHAIDAQLLDLKDKTEKSLPPVQARRPVRKRMDKLLIIFGYYCKISYQEGKEFDQIHRQSQIMNMGKFVCFCKDFKLMTQKLPLQKLVSIFKKHALHEQSLDF
jgi:hypothetical protein